MTLDCTTDGLQYKAACGEVDGYGNMTVASNTVMKMCSKSESFLNGQDIFGVCVNANTLSVGTGMCEGGTYISEYFLEHARAYAWGKVKKDKAIEDFKDDVRRETSLNVY